MEVILIQDVNTLGGKNEVVKVKNGYARNFLIPQGFAVEASPSNVKQLAERLKVQKKKEDAMLAEIKSVISKLTEAPVKLTAKTGTSGKIFGSITTVMIARAIREQKGFEIDRRKIHITDDIKELGNYKVKIDFANGNEAEVELEVVAEA
jgi:large subunit ribosomal protein L9